MCAYPEATTCMQIESLVYIDISINSVSQNDRQTATRGYYNMSTNTQDKHERTHKVNSCPHMTRTTITQLLMCVATTTTYDQDYNHAAVDVCGYNNNI